MHYEEQAACLSILIALIKSCFNQAATFLFLLVYYRPGIDKLHLPVDVPVDAVRAELDQCWLPERSAILCLLRTDILLWAEK